ncbi:hypothetical protein M5K25_027709 [Dendrobium thyrsiflorum]|uniref:Uncharacterized protein n=1 Tax=Dendrobium thyrsiflorum TaxID=117978 RepID=A0ABD0TUP6_DENTH
MILFYIDAIESICITNRSIKLKETNDRLSPSNLNTTLNFYSLGNNIYPEKKSWIPFPAKTRSDNSARIALTVRRAMLEPAITASTTPVVPTTFPNSGHSISLTSSATPAISSSAFDFSSFLDAIISRISAATSNVFFSSTAPSSFFSARFSAAPPLFSWAEKRQRRNVAFCRSDSGAGIRRAGTINGRLKFFRGEGGLGPRKREKEMEAAMDLPGANLLNHLAPNNSAHSTECTELAGAFDATSAARIPFRREKGKAVRKKSEKDRSACENRKLKKPIVMRSLKHFADAVRFDFRRRSVALIFAWVSELLLISV